MPRPDVSEERKEQILDAAARVFSQLGFSQARMDDIVTESRLSKGALYWYFKSKDDIITALMHRFFQQDLEALKTLLSAEGTVQNRLLIYMNNISQEFANMRELMSIIYEYYSAATRHNTIGEFFQQYFAQYQDFIEELITQGITSGEFIQTDARAVTITLSAIVEGSLLLASIAPNDINIKTQIVISTQLVLQGIKA